MDPNATLEELRKLAKRLLAGEEEDSPQTPYRIAELFQSLDQWLTNQGSLPKAWERKEGNGGTGAGKGPG